MDMSNWRRPRSQAESKHHGLRNQGSTCYLNSVLQVLFMTPEFREAVKSHCDNPQTSHIDTQLKRVFDELLKTGSTPREQTEPILQKLGIEDVWKQRDAAEYFEKILNMASPQSSQFFHGGLIHQIECSNCGQSTQESGSFWTLNLAISQTCAGDYSVEDGLKAFFSKSHLTGDNQLYCDSCEEKADATLECKLEVAPEVLLVLLKRFEFSYNMMDYVKNDSPVNVHFNVEIPKGGGYELYATVDHTGSLRGGHYTATIRVPDDGGRWYRFNDSLVTLENNFNPLKSQSAYLLLYKRQERLTESLHEVHSGSSVVPAGFDTAQKKGAAVTTTNYDKHNTNKKPMRKSCRGVDAVMESNDMEVPVMGGVVRGDDIMKGGDVKGVRSTAHLVSRGSVRGDDVMKGGDVKGVRSIAPSPFSCFKNWWPEALKVKTNKRKTSPTRQGGSHRVKKNKTTSGLSCFVCTNKQTSD